MNYFRQLVGRVVKNTACVLVHSLHALFCPAGEPVETLQPAKQCVTMWHWFSVFSHSSWIMMCGLTQGEEDEYNVSGCGLN